MKGTMGLVVAAALGVVGALCNWMYLNRQANDYQHVDFVMISPDAQINLGDRFQESHFAKVAIPKLYAEDQLGHVGIQWKDRMTVLGQRATRSYRGGELLLQQELSTPVQKDTAEMIGEDEVTFEVPIDPRTFVSENYRPGDEVYFFAPRYVASAQNATAAPSIASAASQVAGPFRILALGSRKSSLEVEQAARKRLTREDVITIGLDFKNGQFGKDAQVLFDVLQITGNQGVQVAKISAKK
jgi:hypothetical protein